MILINNKTELTIGPYNGTTIASGASFTVPGAIAPYISDGALLADILAERASVTFANRESFTAQAAALLMQLGQLFNTDSDGANLSRIKQAPSGWTYHLRGFEFTTSLLASLVNKDHNNQDLTDITIRFYDNSGVLLTTQEDIDSSCVKTVVDYEPTYDYYLIGGEAKTLGTPSTDTRISVIGVPDYPAPNGSKVMIQNVNMRYIASGDKVSADGRASKGLLYNNPVPHSNKIRFAVYHSVGHQVPFGIAMETFKA